MADSVFRGYRAIGEVLKSLQPLHEWTRQFKPQQQCLRLPRADYDLIRRWPKAAHCHEIEVLSTGEVWYRGLELVYDSGMSRYAKEQPPQQLDVETPGGANQPGV